MSVGEYGLWTQLFRWRNHVEHSPADKLCLTDHWVQEQLDSPARYGTGVVAAAVVLGFTTVRPFIIRFGLPLAAYLAAQPMYDFTMVPRLVNSTDSEGGHILRQIASSYHINTARMEQAEREYQSLPQRSFPIRSDAPTPSRFGTRPQVTIEREGQAGTAAGAGAGSGTTLLPGGLRIDKNTPFMKEDLDAIWSAGGKGLAAAAIFGAAAYTLSRLLVQTTPAKKFSRLMTAGAVLTSGGVMVLASSAVFSQFYRRDLAVMMTPRASLYRKDQLEHNQTLTDVQREQLLMSEKKYTRLMADLEGQKPADDAPPADPTHSQT
eukprot:TRINITY_DN4457_c0_g1_i1.p1 TRINITY_DN4457_c0_g1~~TRINITY_DN4457_c0_g1_i1.p1  ORF type:complete len:331 (+),score=62.64 TRINITY_DN4457_c0_g1_i1:31-993(+)